MLECRQTSFPLSKDEPRISRHHNQQGRRPSELFFVLKPGPQLSHAMHEVASSHARNYGKGKPHPPHLLHVSLLNVGFYYEPPYALATRIRDAVDSLAARPVHVALDRSALFGNGQHLVLTSSRKNPDLQAFVQKLYATLTRHNVPRAAIRPVSPHVTLIYGYREKELLTVEKDYVWLSRDFSLIYSHNGKTCHEELGRWRLDFDAAPYPVPPEQLRLFN
ncbi:2'-5' RNA ligase superfamily protein [Rhizobium sp. NFR07]|nr:2'-5' RNA ligase superfamily protein [Rhizobium sp. NFR07]